MVVRSRETLTVIGTPQSAEVSAASSISRRTSAGTRDVLTRPADRYTRDLVDAVPFPDPVVQRARRERIR